MQAMNNNFIYSLYSNWFSICVDLPKLEAQQCIVVKRPCNDADVYFINLIFNNA